MTWGVGEETTERTERHWNEIKGTKTGKAFAKNQWISECFVEASLQALKSQLRSIQWTLCWSSDPQVKEVWMRKEQVNDKCNWSETQVTLECPRLNARTGTTGWVILPINEPHLNLPCVHLQALSMGLAIWVYYECYYFLFIHFMFFLKVCIHRRNSYNCWRFVWSIRFSPMKSIRLYLS